jgi:hypothetical protein
VEAFQDKEIEVLVLEGLASPVGTDGGVVSGGGGVGLSTVTVIMAEVVVLPAASRAIADRV